MHLVHAEFLFMNLAGEINTFFTALVLLLLGIQDLQWVKNRLRGISMRLTENYKFGKTHFSLESVVCANFHSRKLIFADNWKNLKKISCQSIFCVFFC